jgi:CrcB protein
MRTWVAIGLAGAVGVLARHAVQQLVPRHGQIPWGTFVVNVSGAFVMGFLFTVIVHRYRVPMWLQEAALVGLLGGYTTFSAVTLETYLILDRGHVVSAVGYVAGSVVAGMVALFVGVHLARLS